MIQTRGVNVGGRNNGACHAAEEHDGLVGEDSIFLDVVADARLFVILWMSIVSGQGKDAFGVFQLIA